MHFKTLRHRQNIASCVGIIFFSPDDILIQQYMSFTFCSPNRTVLEIETNSEVLMCHLKRKPTSIYVFALQQITIIKLMINGAIKIETQIKAVKICVE